MHDHARFDHDVAARTSPAERPYDTQPFWERWAAVLVPAGLALLLALAIVATILISDPNGTSGDYEFPEFGQTFPQPAPVSP